MVEVAQPLEPEAGEFDLLYIIDLSLRHPELPPDDLVPGAGVALDLYLSDVNPPSAAYVQGNVHRLGRVVGRGARVHVHKGIAPGSVEVGDVLHTLHQG